PYNKLNSNISSTTAIEPPNAQHFGGRCAIQTWDAKGAQEDARSYVGTPLQAAVIHDKVDVVEFVLQNNSDICDKFCMHNLIFGSYAAYISFNPMQPNLAYPNTMPPLIVAINAKSRLCARSLIKWRADRNIVSRGMTTLLAAALEGQTDIINYLLKVGADPNVTSFYGDTPIEIAAKLCSHADVMAVFTKTRPIPGISDWSVPRIIEYVNSPEAKEKAICLKPTDAAVFSNRSLCWSRLNDGQHTLQDAQDCIKLSNDWPKAHYRAGVAWGLLQKYERAVKEFKIALDLDPKNKELQEAY
ncbi:Hsp70-Hsp90 organizing protein, partial [Bienertia sinuspersici]